jgi:hypothetical protein
VVYMGVRERRCATRGRGPGLPGPGLEIEHYKTAALARVVIGDADDVHDDAPAQSPTTSGKPSKGSPAPAHYPLADRPVPALAQLNDLRLELRSE